MKTLALPCLAAVAVLSRAAAQEPLAAPRPNIVVVMADDHAAHALSCYGSRINQTPRLDRLASEGMRFTSSFVTNAVCGPARAAVLTGKYSHRNGFARNGDVFDGQQPHVAKLLQQAGYATAVIGKWHLESAPTGFDYHNVLPGQGRYHDPDFLEMGERKKHKGYATDLITDFTIDYLKRRPKDKPFFVLSWHKAPHRPWQPAARHAGLFAGQPVPEPPTFDDDYATRGTAARSTEMTVEHHLTKTDVKAEPPAGLSAPERKRWYYQRYVQDYLRCVAALDESVGRLLDWIDEAGLGDSTLVVYTSDQGFFLGDHGWYDKRFMYEESLRSPLLVRWPNRIAKGSVSRDLVLNVDLAATFLEAAGAQVPGDLQGKSLLPLLRGQTPADWRRSVYYHYYEHPGTHNVHRHRGVRTERHKLIDFYTLGEVELYDLGSDPHELVNLAGDPAHAELRADLTRELERLRRELGDDGSFLPAAAPAKGR